MSEETELQARKMSTGAIISRLSQQDILSICIVVPKLLPQQENLCKDDTRSSLTESDRKLLESAESFSPVTFHMKKARYWANNFQSQQLDESIAACS